MTQLPGQRSAISFSFRNDSVSEMKLTVFVARLQSTDADKPWVVTTLDDRAIDGLD
jgi:hypothetical protein